MIDKKTERMERIINKIMQRVRFATKKEIDELHAKIDKILKESKAH